MLSGIVPIAYFLITVVLVIFFIASGFWQDLLNGIIELKNSFNLFVGYFGGDPTISIVVGLIAVIFVVSLVFAFKPKK